MLDGMDVWSVSALRRIVRCTGADGIFAWRAKNGMVYFPQSNVDPFAVSQYVIDALVEGGAVERAEKGSWAECRVRPQASAALSLLPAWQVVLHWLAGCDSGLTTETIADLSGIDIADVERAVRDLEQQRLLSSTWSEIADELPLYRLTAEGEKAVG